MNLNEAIEIRRSRRKYVPEPLGDDTVAALRQVIDSIVDATGLRLELVLDNGAAFASFRKSYGMFTRVRTNTSETRSPSIRLCA